MHNDQEEIDSKMINALDVFDKIKDNGKQYYLNVPGFQRGFAWNSENVENLFDDFEENNTNFNKELNSLTGYLIGNIVLIKSKDNEYDIVDGQQRITVISLLIKAMSDRYVHFASEEAHSSDTSVNKISQYNNESIELSRKIFDEQNEPKLKHNSGLKYSRTYLNILNDDEVIETGESSSNLRSSWNSIQKYINKLDIDHLNYLYNYLSTKVKIIVAITPSENNAYQLFEALNGRGQELMPLDLIKNSLMKTISSQSNSTISLFNSYWIEFIDNISSIKNNNPTTFLRYFVMKEYGVDKTNSGLFGFFKNLNLNSSEIMKLVEQLRIDSEVYASIIKNPQDNDLVAGNKHGDLLIPGNVLFTLINSMRYRQVHPLLMMFYRSDEETRNMIIENVTKTAISMNFTKTPSENTKQIVKFINIYRASLIDDDSNNVGVRLSEIKSNKKSREKARNTLIKSMQNYNASNEKLLKTSLEESSYTPNTGKVLIKIIEYVINANFYKEITLEHILPEKFENLKVGSEIGHLGFDQEIEKNKQDDEKDIDNQKILEKYVKKLGNFTALINIENNDNKPINIKLPNYQASDFRMTKAICNSWKPTNGKTYKKFIEDRLKYEKSYEYYMHEYKKDSDNDETFIKYLIRKRTTDLANLISKFTSNKLS